MAVRVLRLSLVGPIDDQTRAQLRRIVGQPGTVTSLTPPANMTPGELLEQIRQYDPDIILLDGPVPPNSQVVRSLANEYPVLEPQSELVPSQDLDGPAAVRVRRLGRRNQHGGIDPLGDGALSS